MRPRDLLDLDLETTLAISFRYFKNSKSGIEVAEWNMSSGMELWRISVVLYELMWNFSSCVTRYHVRSRSHSQLAKAAAGICHHSAVSSCIFLIS